MSTESIKASLEANKAEILKNVPEDLQADVEKNISDISEGTPLSEAEVKELVATALPEDSKSDAEDLANELLAPPAQTKEEVEAEILKNLPEAFHADFKKDGMKDVTIAS